MGWMLTGFAGLLAAVLFSHFLRRQEQVLRLQSQVVGARLALESVLRQRWKFVEGWCAACEEKGVLSEHIPGVRKCLLDLRQMALLSARPGEEAEGRLSPARLEEEKKLSHLIREGYAFYLHTTQDGDPHQSFLQSYYRALTQMERDIAQTRDLHNDTVQMFNEKIQGLGGWLLRRWERLEPHVPVPSFAAERLSWSLSRRSALPSVRS